MRHRRGSIAHSVGHGIAHGIGAARAFGLAVVVLVVLVGAGCQSPAWKLPWSATESASAGASSASCPARVRATSPLPRVSPEQRTLAYWLARSAKLDDALLDVDAVAAHNAALAARDRAHPDEDPRGHFELRAPLDPQRIARDVNLRLTYLRARIVEGELLDVDGKRSDPAAMAALEPMPALGTELRVAVGLVEVRCGPIASGLYQGPVVEPLFDRNLCSTLRPGEPLLILADWPGGMRLVRARYVLGFIAPNAPLSPPITGEHREAFAAGDRFVLAGERRQPHAKGQLVLPDRTRLPRASDGGALVATPDGVTKLALAASEATVAPRSLTRRALLEEAFRFLDTPYGWGGKAGGRDCSQLVMDIFASFGLELPRHSGAQAISGSFSIALDDTHDQAVRLALIDAAHARGIVLLELAGHVMLYLGKSDDGRPMVMHAFAEYREACEGGGETLYSVERVEVSDLALGAGTTKKSFLERLRRVTVIGDFPGPALIGVADRRPPAPLAPSASCHEAEDTAILITPRHPHEGAPLRVVVSSARDLGSVTLELRGPDGAVTNPTLEKVGGPPFGYFAELSAPAIGDWHVRLGDGGRKAVCKDFKVHAKPPMLNAADGSVWQPRTRWTLAMESLYGTFVERLFAYPLDDRTWSNLHSLLGNREQNLLYDHLGQGEDKALRLEPDCADLPYFLRAYFSWKLGLPFAYRACNRGRKGAPPFCDRELKSSIIERAERGDVAAFQSFANDSIANGVHSGSGRTAPADDHTDYYPVALNREALTPGAVFADPYGHGYVITAWQPQRFGTEQGMLIGADAQPDGTISRRRFWRGTFIFNADTSEAGSGFKRFRPLSFKGGIVRALSNEAIVRERPTLAPFSLEQYEHGTDGFYDRVEALINPRPLSLDDALNVLLEALFEQAKRRVVSVQNGVEFAAKGRGAVEMPVGHAVFETTGGWEDYSTPSRDMRLLVAIDTVVGFPDAVRRAPERFDIAAKDVESEIARLRTRLDARLGELAFDYTKSDGTAQRLTVKDVVLRAGGFELAYNPNDCAELRWAAPEGSAELATCRRRAPAIQRARMEQYRKWFATRTRPSR